MPDGTLVPVSYTSKNETITRGSAEYTSSLEFDTPSSGLYQLSLGTDPSNPTTVIVARSIGDAIHGVLAWFGVGALGGFIMVVGLVMLIVGATRRGRAKRARCTATARSSSGGRRPNNGDRPNNNSGDPRRNSGRHPRQAQQQQWPPPPTERPPPPRAATAMAAATDGAARGLSQANW